MLGRFLLKFSNLSAAKQFFFARTSYDWAIFVFDSFYMTIIFKESGDVRQVIYNIVLTLVAIFFGFVCGSWLLNRIGVEKTLRLSFILFILTGLVGIYLVQINLMSYVIISIIRGLAEGVFWAAANLVELSGMSADSRSTFYSVSQGFGEFFYIVAPVTLGLLLDRAGTLFPSFVIFSCLCVVAAFLPFSFRNVGKATLLRTNFARIFQKKKIVPYTLIKMSLAVGWMLSWLMFSLVPFVILGGELDVGIYMTASSLVGILISFFTSRFTLKDKQKWGNWLLVCAFLNELVLAWNFTPVFLYINSIGLSLTNSVLFPLEEDFSVRMTNKIDDDNTMNVELNLYQELIYTIARVLLGGAVLLVIASGISLLGLLKLMVVVAAVVDVVNYIAAVKFLGLGQKVNSFVPSSP